ncbi:hypothetical protein GCM10025857_26600 [Alicyclobacillus contaminans]|uniref:DUF6470 family protein n=1 Tax=Alicyclobacillus contaminans TaxID=392016 RepID=UPI000412B971|nr:DUF6470 family protein [Alicyclobacillus contaminans]GMA51303.1 hypothetical protein GCM10025857_26600 [Alicyclobacillus contaminans]
MTPQIQIHQVLGQIGICYEPPVWTIHSAPADLDIQSPAAVLEIHTIPGQLEIDQTQAFADEGLRTPLAFLQYEASRARQAAAQGVAETADWGQRFMHIEKGDPLPQYVMRYRERQPEFLPTLMPRPFSVKIHYQPGHVEIHAEVQPVQISVRPQKPQIDFQPGQVHIDLAQPPQLQIMTPPVGQLLDERV